MIYNTISDLYWFMLNGTYIASTVEEGNKRIVILYSDKGYAKWAVHLAPNYAYRESMAVGAVK